MNNKKIEVIIKVLIVLLLITSITLIINLHNNKNYITDKNYNNINLNNYNKLMIVSHPGDELLWGGSHLIDENYLVVCITCGVDNTETKEFIKVMNKTNDKYIILGYAEIKNKKRSNWSNIKASLNNDLKSIIDLKDWDTIVTHNPNGEYGHAQHEITSQLVTSITTNNLYYFGNYYNKKTLGNYTKQLVPINNLNKKQELIGIYNSETYYQTSFNHMFPYEEWISYEKWGE